MAIAFSSVDKNYTLASKDADTLILFKNSANVTVTIPTNSSVAFPVGTIIFLQQTGAGSVTVAGQTGVVIQSLNSARTIGGRYASVYLFKSVTNTWILTGNLK